MAEPKRWNGSLRRMSFAKAVQGSNGIEGYDASLDDVVAAMDGEPTVGADAQTEEALVGYRDAMTYVLQIADDQMMRVDEGVLKSLHFMMLKHDLAKNPARWRPGAIYVRREATGEIVYEGPDHELVPGLVEEFLGRNTQTYYEVLGDVGQGSWQPGNDARQWVRFCLRAHFLQARTLLQRREEIQSVWLACFDLVEKHRLPERCTAALMDAAYGFRVRRRSYQNAARISWAERFAT